MSRRIQTGASAFAVCVLAACSSGTPTGDGGTDSLRDAADAGGDDQALDVQSSDGPSPDLDAGATDGNAAMDSGDATPAPVDAGDAGSVGPADGAVPTDAATVADTGPPPVITPPVCPTGATWSTGTLLAISTAADDNMGAVTPDERTIAWTAVTGTMPSVMVADRNGMSGPFGAPMAIPLTTGFYAPERVALSPDGARLVMVRSDYKAFGAIGRASRGVAFPSPLPQDGEFNLINSTPNQGELAVHIADPVMGAQDKSFYYSLYGSGLLDTIIASSRADMSSWPNGSALRATANDFQTAGPSRRRPTGIASDDRTLFYWDEVDSTEKVAWRPTATSTFDHFETLGGTFRGAVPNANCDKLYYSAAGPTGGLDLFVASRQ